MVANAVSQRNSRIYGFVICGGNKDHLHRRRRQEGPRTDATRRDQFSPSLTVVPILPTARNFKKCLTHKQLVSGKYCRQARASNY